MTSGRRRNPFCLRNRCCKDLDSATAFGDRTASRHRSAVAPTTTLKQVSLERAFDIILSHPAFARGSSSLRIA